MVRAERGEDADVEGEPADAALVGAWLDASMTAALQPASTMSAKVRLSSIAGGVVISACAISRPSSISTVPMSPVRTPAWFMIPWIRWATVVLPLVPVMPTSLSFSGGVAVEALGDLGRDTGDVFRDERYRVPCVDECGALGVGQDRDRAVAHGLLDVLPAIFAHTGPGDEERAREHRSTVVGQIADAFARGRTGRRLDVEGFPGEEPAQFHGAHPARQGPFPALLAHDHTRAAGRTQSPITAGSASRRRS